MLQPDTTPATSGPSLLKPPNWCDQPLPEDADITAAHPMNSGRNDLYTEAMRLVGARRSKAGLVELVTWLLLKAECVSGKR
ncbi:MAG: hypothetical protein P4L90_25830 [Rhodopila sp.]|nr:hypothetical protein [Rhodopila sp.]